MIDFYTAFIGRHFSVGAADWNKLYQTYDRVDIEREFRMMDDWLESNPRRRKKNYRRFITNWLKAEQRKAERVRPEVMVGAGPVLSDEARERLQARLAERKSR